MFQITSNINELIQKFKNIREMSENIDPSEALLVGVNAARGAMSNRIFNQGQDSSNNSLGEYKGNRVNVIPKKKQKNQEFFVGVSVRLLTPYEKKRVEAGRQVRYKDLEFTGTLRRGIVVIQESQRRVVCSIPNDDLFKIARGQEEQLKTQIFSLSDDEREILRINTIEALNQLYGRLFNTK